MMTSIDYLVLVGYLLGILAAGFVFAGVNKSSAEMFAAGGRSPWWAAGLSGFMTMFSAGTFVVWGGIAYKFGLVAICINLCYGVAALLAGYFVAGRWKRLGIRTPAEFVRLRFGSGALHFYTWSMMLFRMVGVGVSLYALAVVLVTLMPLDPGNPLRDAVTGNFSLPLAILLFGGIVVAYTLVGGLWAVLIVDVLQFIVLNLSVLFVVVLSLSEIGGVKSFVEAAPEGFFLPIGGGYTWWFLAGWCAIHFFMIGAEWAFVQRYLCVPSERDARKGTYLFGVLYLVSPFLWMLPPMIWRINNPIASDATAEQIRLFGEQAYIAQCRSVLPSGMVGMLLAAMFSATASTVSGQLNVFAGVLTNDIYRPLVRGPLSEQRLVWAGRLFTLLLGTALIAIAISVPYLGGAEAVVVAVNSLAVGPLMAPILLGLVSRSVNAAAVWATAAICLPLIAIVKSGVISSNSNSGWMSNLGAWIEENSRTVDIGLGVLLPVVVLVLVQAVSRGTARGWQRVELLGASSEPLSAPSLEVGPSPARVVGWSIAICGGTMAVLTAINESSRATLGVFSLALIAIAAFVLVRSRPSGPVIGVERSGTEKVEHVEV